MTDTSPSICTHCLIYMIYTYDKKYKYKFQATKIKKGKPCFEYLLLGSFRSMG